MNPFYSWNHFHFSGPITYYLADTNLTTNNILSLSILFNNKPSSVKEKSSNLILASTGSKMDLT
jgi:hypothetical protein